MNRLLGQLDAGRHQHRRPEDGVELEDVLAHHVERRRPEALRQVLAVAREGERRVVVEQRVEPDVEDVARVPRDLDAPVELRAAERDVVQAAADERERLVVAVARADEVGPLGVELLERLLEARRAGRTSSPRARGRAGSGGSGTCCLGPDLGLGLEVRAAGAVPALVQALVDVPVVVDRCMTSWTRSLVPRVGGADEEVVGDVDARAAGPGSAGRCGRRAPSA